MMKTLRIKDLKIAELQSDLDHQKKVFSDELIELKAALNDKSIKVEELNYRLVDTQNDYSRVKDDLFTSKKVFDDESKISRIEHQRLINIVTNPI